MQKGLPPLVQSAVLVAAIKCSCCATIGPRPMDTDFGGAIYVWHWDILPRCTTVLNFCECAQKCVGRNLATITPLICLYDVLCRMHICEIHHLDALRIVCVQLTHNHNAHWRTDLRKWLMCFAVRIRKPWRFWLLWTHGKPVDWEG